MTYKYTSFNRLILVIFGKHEHAFKKDVPIRPSLSLHFCLLYLVLNSSDGNDAMPLSLNVCR